MFLKLNVQAAYFQSKNTDHDYVPSKRTYQSLRQRGHDYTLPPIRTERFRAVL